MRRNVGTIDRSVRLVLAAGAVAGSGVLGFTGAWGIVLLVFAGIMVATALTARCLPYALLGIDTLERDRGAASADETMDLPRAA